MGRHRSGLATRPGNAIQQEGALGAVLIDLTKTLLARIVLLYRGCLGEGLNSCEWHKGAGNTNHLIPSLKRETMTNLLLTTALTINFLTAGVATPAFGTLFCSTFGAWC